MPTGTSRPEWWAFATSTFFLDAGSDWPVAVDLLQKAKAVLCQSRLEFTPRSTAYIGPTFDKGAHALTHDAWFFIPPLKPPAIDFELGCGNALAERICRVGYLPANFASRFRVMHYDVCRGKNAENIGKVLQAESARRSTVSSRHPEPEGCFLVPDFDRMTSLDTLVSDLGFSRLLKCKLICEVMSYCIKIHTSWRPQGMIAGPRLTWFTPPPREIHAGIRACLRQTL